METAQEERREKQSSRREKNTKSELKKNTKRELKNFHKLETEVLREVSKYMRERKIYIHKILHLCTFNVKK